MIKLMNKSEYGRHRGVTHAAVNRAVADGRITLIDGKIDPVVADIQWEQNTRALARSGTKTPASTEMTTNAIPPTQGVENYGYWKGRRERAEAIRAEQSQELEAGNLVYKDQMQRAAKNAARMMRDQLLSVPSRLAAELASINDATVIEQKVRAELRAALSGMDKLLYQTQDDAVIDDDA